MKILRSTESIFWRSMNVDCLRILFHRWIYSCHDFFYSCPDTAPPRGCDTLNGNIADLLRKMRKILSGIGGFRTTQLYSPERFCVLPLCVYVYILVCTYFHFYPFSGRIGWRDWIKRKTMYITIRPDVKLSRGLCDPHMRGSVYMYTIIFIPGPLGSSVSFCFYTIFHIFVLRLINVHSYVCICFFNMNLIIIFCYRYWRQYKI